MRIVAAALCAVTFILLAASCGDGGAKTDESAEKTENAGGETREPVPTGKTAETGKTDEKTAETTVEKTGGAKTQEQLPDTSEVTVREITLPDDSAVFSAEFAKQMIRLCSGYSASSQKELFENAGFETVMQINYDKPKNDPSHTCAFSVGEGKILYKGKVRSAIVIASRGTSGAEWLSNFDISESRTNDTVYADNFYAAARDVMDHVSGLLEETGEPILLIGGHSRGAACSNILGVMVSDRIGVENTFVYTCATPCTVRGDKKKEPHPNVFNIVNACDIVPRLPLEAWDYGRFGTDIILCADQGRSDRITEGVAELAKLAPTIYDYYNTRRSVIAKGGAFVGMPVFDFMNLLAGALATTGLDKIGTQINFGVFDENSDFAPIIRIVSELTANGGQLAISLGNEHTVNTYLSLLEQ